MFSLLLKKGLTNVKLTEKKKNREIPLVITIGSKVVSFLGSELKLHVALSKIN